VLHNSLLLHLGRASSGASRRAFCRPGCPSTTSARLWPKHGPQFVVRLVYNLYRISSLCTITLSASRKTSQYDRPKMPCWYALSRQSTIQLATQAYTQFGHSPHTLGECQEALAAMLGCAVARLRMQRRTKRSESRERRFVVFTALRFAARGAMQRMAGCVEGVYQTA